MCVNVSASHLAVRVDVTTEGAFVVEETADEIFVGRHFHSVHYVLQRVVDFRLLKQRDDELAAPPAGQVVQRQQTPAHPLHSSTPGEQRVNAADETTQGRCPFNYIKTIFPCQHRRALNKPSGYFPRSLTCLSGLFGSIGGSGWSVQIRWWKGSRRGRCSRDRAPFTSPPLSRRASSHWDASLKPREWSSFICNTTGRDVN